jgi:hypothetical protein
MATTNVAVFGKDQGRVSANFNPINTAMTAPITTTLQGAAIEGRISIAMIFL